LKTFTTKTSLTEYLNTQRIIGKTIGLVPTMGALHMGHISLLNAAKQQCDIVVCTIFVNPTQFNDPKDLERYPRPIEQDTQKLIEFGCDALFNPPVEEMYENDTRWYIDLGEIEHVLEGSSRPGHYKGVTQIVFKLFNLVKPDMAFFGQKDYQQVMVINKMVEIMQLPVRVLMCPIIRESDGLAMSSRNVHLSTADRQHSLVLSRALEAVKNSFDINKIAAAKQMGQQMIGGIPGVTLDYFEIADGNTLLPATTLSAKIVALVAAKVGNTRLIDNMILG
jgi:pantoate--beta-alanine ligase